MDLEQRRRRAQAALEAAGRDNDPPAEEGPKKPRRRRAVHKKYPGYRDPLDDRENDDLRIIPPEVVS